MEFTIRIEKSDDGWYVGQIEEIPAAISQGKTIEELKANLLDALQLVFEVNREEVSAQDSDNKNIIKERLILAS